MHYWYSAKQDAHFARRIQLSLSARQDYPLNFALINEKVVRYTHANDSREHICKWDDMQYLGEGNYHHSESR